MTCLKATRLCLPAPYDITGSVAHNVKPVLEIFNNTEGTRYTLLELLMHQVVAMSAIHAVLSNCKRFVHDRTATTWTIAADNSLMVTTSGESSTVTSRYEPVSSSTDPTSAMFIQEPDDHWSCKRLVIEPKTATTWTATLEINHWWPYGEWEASSRIKLRSD